MTKRLDMICSLIRSKVGIADIGTDHGMIPVHFAEAGYEGNLFASDINEMPLQTARDLAAERGVQEKITFRCCNGLELCDPKIVDSIVIAGMGGELIISILNQAEWVFAPQYQLLLQPMTKPELLRYWLINNGFVIEEERLVKEAGRIFSIMAARFQNVYPRYRDAELFVGKPSQTNDRSLLREELSLERQRLEKRLKGLENNIQKLAEYRLYHAIYNDFIQWEESL